jgi:hypothetical protein
LYSKRELVVAALASEERLVFTVAPPDGLGPISYIFAVTSAASLAVLSDFVIVNSALAKK